MATATTPGEVYEVGGPRISSLRTCIEINYAQRVRDPSVKQGGPLICVSMHACMEIRYAWSSGDPSTTYKVMHHNAQLGV